VAQEPLGKVIMEVTLLVVLISIITLEEEVLEGLVKTEHQLEEEMEGLGFNPQLLVLRNIMPAVGVVVVTNLHQVLVVVLEVSVVVELVEQLDRTVLVYQELQILVEVEVAHQPLLVEIQVEVLEVLE
jgi:hypothetical protein